jgi:hypothetical protein
MYIKNKSASQLIFGHRADIYARPGNTIMLDLFYSVVTSLYAWATSACDTVGYSGPCTAGVGCEHAARALPCDDNGNFFKKMLQLYGCYNLK